MEDVIKEAVMLKVNYPLYVTQEHIVKIPDDISPSRLARFLSFDKDKVMLFVYGGRVYVYVKQEQKKAIQQTYKKVQSYKKGNLNFLKFV